MFTEHLIAKKYASYVTLSPTNLGANYFIDNFF